MLRAIMLIDVCNILICRMILRTNNNVHMLTVQCERKNLICEIRYITRINQWRTFTQMYSTGVARVPTVVSGAFYYRLDVCTGLCKLLFQTQFLSNYPTIIIFYLYNNIPQVNNKCIISCNHLTKLLMWSHHYVEIRQGQRCNHIWVTDTCYYVITVNAKITRKFNTFLFIFFCVLHEQKLIFSISL